MEDDFFRRDYGAPKRSDNLFGWTVFILLLLALALTCWIGSFYIFGHPESPRSYAILKKLKKVDPPKRFELTAAPPGTFLTPQKLYETYSTYSRLELEKENAQLLRNYINNYGATKKLVPYVVGRFNILDSFELKPTDMFGSGVVALAQAVDSPQVMIEHVYTAEPKTVPLLRRMLQTGLDIKLEKTLDLAAVLHIEKLYDGRLQFTVVPLLYGSYALKQASGTFSLEPPADLNLAAGAPIVSGNTLQEALKTFADYKRKAGPEPGAIAVGPSPTPGAVPVSTAAPAVPEIVRVETTPTPPPVEEATPPPRLPAIVKATPTPTPGKLAGANTPIPTGRPVAFASPVVAAPTLRPVPLETPPELAANITPRPTPPPVVQTPTPMPVVQATPAPAATALPSGVQLQPFLESRPEPKVASTGASWRTFAPGQMPKGRVVEPPDADELAEHGMAGERLYLRGEFVVTAAGENRAVLRSQAGATGRGSVRVIAEFPAGTEPPTEGATLARDDARPFQITDVRRGADGQVNVYVREITTP